jgi:hypothetical protein
VFSVPARNARLSIRTADAETVEILTNPLMLLSLTGDLLSIAAGDPTPHGYDTLLMAGVQLDEDSESLLLCPVSDTRSRSRYNDPAAPEKLEPLQVMRGYGGLQLNASKDGLIRLSEELIHVLMAGAGESRLASGNALGDDSLAVKVVLLAPEGRARDARS